MNIRDLEYIISVAKEGHFGKAAKANFISQPSLSIQIKKVEQELGITLFERNNRRVEVTETAKPLIEQIQKVLLDIKNLKEMALSSQDPFAGKLTLGVFPTLAPYILPLIIPVITQNLPKLKLHIIEEKTDLLIEKLQQGTIDTALLASPINLTSLEESPLFEDPFFLALSSNHKWSKRKHITQKELLNEHLLLLEEGHCLRDQALSFCHQAGADEDQNFRATSLETLRQMVSANLGITLIPQIAITKQENLTYIPFKKPIPSRTISMYTRPKSPRKTCLTHLHTLIKSTLPRHLT